MGDWDLHIHTYIEQITNKNYLYRAGNSAQYSVMIRMGKESKRVDICICMTDPLCCTPETKIAL